MRFPHFGALAAKSWWYPNAIAPYFNTTHSVPSILTGRKPRPNLNLSSTARDYPRSLFTLLAKQYHFNVFEPLTEMCPEEVCLEENSGTA